MAETITAYDRAVNRLFRAALLQAEYDLGGEPSDWQVTFEGPGNVVLKAWRDERFGTFAATLNPADQTVRTESYGTRRFLRD
jgi:hypothetical protein